MSPSDLDLAQIAAKNSPDDPAALTAFAQALAAADDPRAALVRLGLVFAAESSPSKALAEARAARLAWGATHGASLCAQYGVRDFEGFRFRGGMVRGLLGTAASLAHVKPSLFEGEPCDALEFALGEPDDARVLEALLSHGAIRSLTLYGTCDGALYERLAALPSLGKLRLFSHNHDKIAAASLRLFVASPHWQSLEVLDLGYSVTVDDSVVVALCENEHLTTLKSLDVAMTKTTDAGLAAVAAAPHFALESLNFSFNAVKLPKTLSALSAGPHGKTLRALSLGHCPLKAAGIEALLVEPLPRLSHLDVGHTRLGDAGLCDIAASKSLPSLEVLRVPGNDVRGKGLIAIVASPSLPALRTLDVGQNRLGKGAGAALGEKGALDSLEELDLSFNSDLGRAGLQAIVTSKGLSSLTSLNLDQTKMTAADVAAWAAGGALPSLTTLSLRYSPVGDAGAMTIANAPAAERLVWLSLHGAGLTDPGVLAIARSTRLTKLEHLDLSQATAAPETWLALTALPALRSLRGGDYATLVELDRVARFVVMDLHRDVAPDAT